MPAPTTITFFFEPGFCAAAKAPALNAAPLIRSTSRRFTALCASLPGSIPIPDSMARRRTAALRDPFDRRGGLPARPGPPGQRGLNAGVVHFAGEVAEQPDNGRRRRFQGIGAGPVRRQALAQPAELLLLALVAE